MLAQTPRAIQRAVEAAKKGRAAGNAPLPDTRPSSRAKLVRQPNHGVSVDGLHTNLREQATLQLSDRYRRVPTAAWMHPYPINRPAVQARPASGSDKPDAEPAEQNKVPLTAVAEARHRKNGCSTRVAAYISTVKTTFTNCTHSID